MVTGLAVVLRISAAEAAFHLWFLTIFWVNLMPKINLQVSWSDSNLCVNLTPEPNQWMKYKCSTFENFTFKFAENSFHSMIFSGSDHDFSFFYKYLEFLIFFHLLLEKKRKKRKMKKNKKHCFTSQMHLRKITERFIYFSIVM